MAGNYHKSLPPAFKNLTRAHFVCPVFGTLSALKQTMLPTYADIIKYYLYVRTNLRNGRLKEPTAKEIARTVTLHLQEIWAKASIPIISIKKIEEKILSFHAKYRALLKPFKGRSGEERYQEKLNVFREESEKLFDVATCKCIISICSCDKSRKVPINEKEFLADQRTDRKMMIGNIDKKTTKQLQQRERRNELNSRSQSEPSQHSAKYFKFHAGCSLDIDQRQIMDINDTSKDNAETPKTQDVKEPSPAPEPSKSSVKDMHISQMRIKLPTLARECDRWGVSDRSAAAIATAVLQDVGIIHDKDLSSVIDPSKLRRERKKHREELKTKTDKNQIMEGLYFDGRKDKTRKIVKKSTQTYHPLTVIEEHVVLVKEPGTEYLGHVTPTSGTSSSLKTSIINFLVANDISTESLVAVGCDGTVVNTGTENGVIRQMEIHLNHSIHWFVCLLHMNELPLRHLLVHLDGSTHGPKSFSGTIGKALSTCNKPIINFDKVDGNRLPEVDIKELSNDQKYLYDISHAVMSGVCSAELSDRQPGPVAHSRWLTTASRILRIYVSEENPSNNLITLVGFIVKVYVPIWFEIKTKSSVSDGARNLWKMIQYSRYLEADLRKIIDPVIQRNSYFAHQENICLAMMADKRDHIRKLAFRTVITARTSKNLTSANVRKFKIPTLNFEATEYFDMIDWLSIENLEPPLTRSITQEELESFVSPNITAPILEFPNFPSHTQAVERCIRLVTEASASVCENQRDGYIRSRLESRSIMKCFNKKTDYKLK